MKTADLSVLAKTLADSVQSLARGDSRTEARRAQTLSRELVARLAEAEQRFREAQRWLPPPPLRSLVGHSPAWRKVLDAIEHAVDEKGPVLFWGEPGTGKTLAARALHELRRSRQPLAVLDASSIPRASIERALQRPAPILLKHAELLGKAPRGGGRILTAEKRLDDVLAIRLPPLRERREDVPALLYHFLGRTKLVGFDRPALEKLLHHPYPGNIAELESIVERIGLVAEGPLVGLFDLPEEFRQAAAPASPIAARTAQELRQAKREARDLVERRFLIDALRRSGGKVTAAAKETGVHRTRLAQLMAKYKIRLSDFRTDR